MNKISATIDYKFPVLSADVIVIDDSEDDNPHILRPYRTYKEGVYKYLVYSVTDRGKTLREFVAEVNKPPEHKSFRTSLRSSLRRQPHIRINPLDIIMKLIDVCEGLLCKNKLLSQSHINPDLIWVDYDANNNMSVRLHDIMECEVANENIREFMYLSPELLGKRNHLLCLDTHPEIQKRHTLNRYDTRPSTLSSVYSLGLVLYFIVNNADPYEGSRISVNERPQLTDTPTVYSKLIWIATNENPKERPTLKEFREIVINMRNPKSSVCC